MRHRKTAWIPAVLLASAFVALPGLSHPAEAQAPGPPHQANGVKVGEVTPKTAIIWTRLTQHPQRLNSGSGVGKDVPPDQMEGAVPGAPGEVRVVFWRNALKARVRHTRWVAVDPERDFTHQFRLTRLRPNTEFLFRVECRAHADAPVGPSLEGRFRTAPARGDPARVVFTVVTGQMYWDRDREDGYQAYPAMAALDPSFFVHTGDILYYDQKRPKATNVPLARYHWHRMYSLPTLVEFHKQVPSYFIKDDHDTLKNDCWPGQKAGDLTWEQGLAIFPEQVPMGDSTYRTVRWGKDLQIWMVEGRDFRSPNNMPDGPDKTIWGQKQKAWLKRTVAESDATFKVLISPTPIVGPDRESKADNHANKAFQHEGDEIRRWIRDHAPELVVVCGDRHWQYASVHPETGVREYCCGPISDQHAGGFREKIEDYHRYFNVVGGFLAGTVERLEGKPTLTFRHYSVKGEVLFEDRLTAGR
ncbi:MAG: alkaline phosphatase D family protein [Armatimonadota bacterium]